MAMDVMATVMKLQTVVDADTHGLAFSRISQRKCCCEISKYALGMKVNRLIIFD